MTTLAADAAPRAPELQIKNFVSSANLGMRFDLANVLLKSHRRAEFGPKKNCLVMKLGPQHAPRGATAMLFANGKLVCTGADSEESIKAAARKFTQLIQKMDYPNINLIDFKIQNVVASCRLGFRVLLEELSFAHSDACTYEPEVYPALIYRLDRPKVKILVFVSGKVVFSGAKDARDLRAAFTVMYPILCQFKDEKQAVDAESDAALSTVDAADGKSHDDDDDEHEDAAMDD